MTNPNEDKCLFDRVMDAVAPLIFIGLLVALPLKLWISNPDGFWRGANGSPPTTANECSVVGIAERCF